MSSKSKKTTSTTKTKRTEQWNRYFTSAITGMMTNPEFYPIDDSEVEITSAAANVVKRAEKIADIAVARNS